MKTPTKIPPQPTDEPKAAAVADDDGMKAVEPVDEPAFADASAAPSPEALPPAAEPDGFEWSEEKGARGHVISCSRVGEGATITRELVVDPNVKGAPKTAEEARSRLLKSFTEA